MPKISVIVPVFNVEKYIETCLKSIQSQTYKDFEVLVVDDGSQDSAPTICDQFGIADSRFKIFHKENEGVSTALNLGLKYAQGEWIYFIDGDDWIEQNTFEALLEHLSLNDDVDIIGFNHFYNDSYEEKKAPNLKNHLYQGKEVNRLIAASVNPKYIEKKYKENLPVIRARWSKLFRRECVKNISFDKKLTTGQDAFYCTLALQRSSRVLLVNEYLYHYRIVEQSNIHKYREKWDHYYRRAQLYRANEDLQVNEYFTFVFAMFELECLVSLFTRFLLHPQCDKSRHERELFLKKFLKEPSMHFNTPKVSMFFYLPYHYLIILCMRFQMIKVLFFIGKFFKIHHG